MSNYTPANPDDYMWQTENPGRPNKLTTYGFRTPDGVECTFGQSSSASCVGNRLPSIPPVCDPPKRNYGANEISTDIGLREVGMPCDDTSLSNVLPPFHTLTVFGVTCGVDDKGTTACKDPQGRGFVLSPTWSGWIPKI
ncbi:MULTISPECIES: SUR7/PalI family protein [Mycobacterium]|uniref:SUR7/PalI family protein n=1 Tax=Mycobacterium TaxID=1763 RepID=UPI001EF111E3|nr:MULTISPECIES: SUR7/PalI family protein [Mycobacterium]